jgi:hypothetical protein
MEAHLFMGFTIGDAPVSNAGGVLRLATQILKR